MSALQNCKKPNQTKSALIDALSVCFTENISNWDQSFILQEDSYTSESRS